MQHLSLCVRTKHQPRHTDPDPNLGLQGEVSLANLEMCVCASQRWWVIQDSAELAPSDKVPVLTLLALHTIRWPSQEPGVEGL